MNSNSESTGVNVGAPRVGRRAALLATLAALFYMPNRALALVHQAQAAINKVASLNQPRPAQSVVLSMREQDVLTLIARGFSYKEIAGLQSLSVHTVQTHIKKLYAKLSVNSKSEAVFEATRMGLLPLH